MNAKEAKQVSLRVKNKLIGENEIIWLILSEHIFSIIIKDILTGANFSIFNLIDKPFSEFSIKDFDFIKNKLEEKDFNVEYKLEKNLFLKNKMIVKW